MKVMRVIRKGVSFLVGCSLVLMIIAFFKEVKPMPLIPEEVTAAIGVPYKVQDIHVGNKRPNQKRKIKYIVIHNTANSQSTAQNEVDYLSNANNTSSTSFHIAVDDHEIIEAIPPTEIAFHAGTKEGNQYGIGIEICESGNYEKAEENAAKLVAYLMQYYNISLDDVKTHQDFSGKPCPRLILNHWVHFKQKIETNYETLQRDSNEISWMEHVKHKIEKWMKQMPLFFHRE